MTARRRHIATSTAHGRSQSPCGAKAAPVAAKAPAALAQPWLSQGPGRELLATLAAQSYPRSAGPLMSAAGRPGAVPPPPVARETPVDLVL